MLISAKIGCAPQPLYDRVKKAEVDSGKRLGVSSEMAERMRALERKNRELRLSEEDQKTIRGIVFPTNEILRKGEPLSAIVPRTMASAYFAMVPRWATLLDALELAVHERRPVKEMGLVHHSD